MFLQYFHLAFSTVILPLKRRYLNVNSIYFKRDGRQIDGKTTLCAYWRAKSISMAIKQTGDYIFRIHFKGPSTFYVNI